MMDIPIQQTTVDRGTHGQQSALQAITQAADSTLVTLQIAGADDAFSKGIKEYRVQLGDHAASVRVSPDGSVTSISNQHGARVGAVRGAEGLQAAQELATVMQQAFTDGKISPQELANITSEARDIIGMPSLAGRVGKPRGATPER